MNLRYSKQIKLQEVGEHGQLAITNSKVLIVGMGGLGCPSSQYLLAAGVGNLGIVDGDRVEESNLHRQILFSQKDIGRSKVEAASQQLQSINPAALITTYFEHINFENAKSIIGNYDIIVDCTDNFEAKYLLNDLCLQLGKVLVTAASTGFEGMLTVFNATRKGNGPCLRCLYPQIKSAEVGNCNLTGILGAFVGIIGSWQAAEVLKIILSNDILSGRVLFFDFYTSQIRSVSFQKNPKCICSNRELIMEKINSESIYLTREQIRTSNNMIIVDIRTNDERNISPISNLDESKELIFFSYQRIIDGDFNRNFWIKDRNYVLCCSAGVRSASAANFLRDQGYKRIYSMRH